MQYVDTNSTIQNIKHKRGLSKSVGMSLINLHCFKIQIRNQGELNLYLWPIMEKNYSVRDAARKPT